MSCCDCFPSGAFPDHVIRVFTAVVMNTFQPFDCPVHTAPINQLAVLVTRIVFGTQLMQRLKVDAHEGLPYKFGAFPTGLAVQVC